MVSEDVEQSLWSQTQYVGLLVCFGRAQQSLDDTVALLCIVWWYSKVLGEMWKRAEEMSRKIESVRAKDVGVSRWKTLCMHDEQACIKHVT